MKIKKLSLNNPKWDKFCSESNDCWFTHTIDYLQYTLELDPENSELLAFYIDDGNGDILAICPLIRHKNKLTFFKSNSPNPALRNGLSKKLSTKLLGQIFNEIDSIANEYGLDECLISLVPLAKNHLVLHTYNYLMMYNYENVSLNTQILDLDKDKKIIWGDIKKGHRNDIKKGQNLFNFYIDLPYSTDDKAFLEFKNLHYLAAGGMTRSEKTWDFQYKWKINGNAVIILAYMDNIPVGGIYAILYKNGAYYGLSANHPDYEHLPISHSIQWEMIKWLLNNRYRYYELGYQYLSEQPYYHPTQKELNIGLFKRHFGGYLITYHRGLKRYDRGKIS